MARVSIGRLGGAITSTSARFSDPAGRRASLSVPGAIPQWRGDGRELFWQGPAPEDRTTTVLYSAELTIAGDNVRVSAPKRLFPPHVHFDSLIDNRRQWAAAPDGRHFVLRQATGLPGSAVKVILNWQSLLRGQ